MTLWRRHESTMVAKNILGAKLKVVTGYPGSREISLAVERGEAQGACGLAWPSISVTQPAIERCFSPLTRRP